MTLIAFIVTSVKKTSKNIEEKIFAPHDFLEMNSVNGLSLSVSGVSDEHLLVQSETWFESPQTCFAIKKEWGKYGIDKKNWMVYSIFFKAEWLNDPEFKDLKKHKLLQAKEADASSKIK